MRKKTEKRFNLMNASILSIPSITLFYRIKIYWNLTLTSLVFLIILPPLSKKSKRARFRISSNNNMENLLRSSNYLSLLNDLNSIDTMLQDIKGTPFNSSL